jgi:uncharacterized protein
MEELMRVLLAAVVIVLSISAPPVYADETSQRALVEDLLQTMRVDQMMKPLFGQMRSLMEQQFARMGAPEEMKPILNRYIGKLVNLMEQTMSWQTLKKDLIDIYMRVYSEDEMKGMLAFYKSPIGQSVLDKMPAVMQQSMVTTQKHMPEMQEKLKKIVEELQEEVKAEMEKKKPTGKSGAGT